MSEPKSTFTVDNLRGFSAAWGYEQLILNIGIFIHEKGMTLELMEFFHELRQNESDEYRDEIQNHRESMYVPRNQKHETGIREIMQNHSMISSS